MSTVARIRVEVEIGNSGSYGPDWTLEAIRKQVAREATEKLHRLIVKDGGRIIGEPKVITIIDTEEK